MQSNPQIDAVLKSAVETGDVPGVVALAATGTEVIYEGAFGLRAVGRPEPMTDDTVFWIASMTKAIVSAAAMQMVEQGRIGLDDEVGTHLPELKAPSVLEGWEESGAPRLRPARKAVTLRHLLTHTAGFSYEMWNVDIIRYQQHAGLPGIITCREAALATPLVADPGTRWEYGINIDFVGKLVEKLSGKKLGDYLQESIFAPLGMTETGFRIRPNQRQRLAAMHARGADGGLTPIEFEIPQDPEFQMGGGGLYSVGRDYLAFTRMILGSGALGTARVLKPETVALMAQNHIGPIDVTRLVSVAPEVTHDAEFFPGMVKKWGLGFMISTEPVSGRRAAQSLTWAGLGNTYFWIDPASQVCGVILTQVLPFADARVLATYDAFEGAVYRAASTTKAA